MIRLVVNADDLGLHPAIDAGILRAHRDGIVTSATVLVTGRTAEAAVRQASAQGLSLGVHLCFSTRLPPALPASEVPSLAPDGRFRASWTEVAWAWLRGEVRVEDVSREVRAQIRRARGLGMEPDHLDGHQHLHLLPGFAEVVTDVAREERLPVRWPGERPTLEWLWRPGPALKSGLLSALGLRALDRTFQRIRGIGLFEAGALDEAALLRLVAALPPGDHELGCHPGEDPGTVPEDPGWRYGWTSELAALCSPRVRAALRSRSVELIDYRILSASKRT